MHGSVINVNAVKSLLFCRRLYCIDSKTIHFLFARNADFLCYSFYRLVNKSIGSKGVYGFEWISFSPFNSFHVFTSGERERDSGSVVKTPTVIGFAISNFKFLHFPHYSTVFECSCSLYILIYLHSLLKL